MYFYILNSMWFAVKFDKIFFLHICYSYLQFILMRVKSRKIFYCKYFLYNIQNMVISNELVITLLFMDSIFLINSQAIFSCNFANNSPSLILFLWWSFDSNLVIFYFNCFLCVKLRIETYCFMVFHVWDTFVEKLRT